MLFGGQKVACAVCGERKLLPTRRDGQIRGS